MRTALAASLLTLVALILSRPVAGQSLGLNPPRSGAWMWPVRPLFEQHPIRAGFMDPRPNGIYHTGIDISVRDDRPEPGHPRKRTHTVYALEGGTVSMPAEEQKWSCQARRVRVGDFGYGHVDPVGTVHDGEQVDAGQMLGWTCYHHWHLHLSEFATRGGRQVYVNPLRPGGRLAPYIDTAPPRIETIDFYAPTTPVWQTLFGALYSSPDGDRLRRTELHGLVDVRAQAEDPQSYQGWMKGRLRVLRAAISPYKLRVSLRSPLGDPLASRVVFTASELPARSFNAEYAPGTVENLPAYDCLVNQPISCAGEYWFHASPTAGSPYWNTTTVADGDYDLCVTALDVAGNSATRCVAVTVANHSFVLP